IKSEHLILYSALTLSLILIAGTRYETGYDYGSYKDLFNTVNLSNFTENTTEIGFAFLFDLFKKLHLSYASFLIFIAFLSISLKTVFFYKNSKFPIFSLAVYISLGLLYNDMG